MNTGFKKIIAASAASACVLALGGCSDSGSLMTVDGMEIRNGIYLSFQQTAYSNAYTEITDAQAEYGDTSEVSDVFSQTIGDMSASEWIKQNTLEQVLRFVAVQRLCEENGVALTDEETAYIKSDLSEYWDEENIYMQYFYGFDTMGEYYESLGVGEESMREINIVNELSDMLFLKYYDTDGITPVTDDEFDSYIKENYASVKLIEIEFDDYQGLDLDEEADAEEIQSIRDTAQSYVDRINGGESFIEIKYDYDLLNAQNDTRVAAEDSYAEETAEDLPDYDEYVQSSVDSATAEKASSEEELDTVISMSSSSLDEDVTEFIWNMNDDSVAATFETEDSIYVVVRDDILTKESWQESNRTTILSALRSDDYEELLAEEYADYVVEQNDYLVNTKYAPEKMKGLE